MTERKKILSLGAGVQSSVLGLMSARGELPKLDAAVFADTGWEPKPVYDHLQWLMEEMAKGGIYVTVLNPRGSIKENTSPLEEAAQPR